MNNEFTHETIESEDFERYIIVKGENLRSVEPTNGFFGYVTIFAYQ